MAIKICPECGGKVFAGRQDCPHCGYLFPREGEKKLCPGCEETIVPNPDGTCPVCGYAFESAPAPDSEGLFGGEQSDVPTAPLPGDIDRYFEYETLSDGSYKINGCKDAYVTKLSLPEGTKVIGAHALAGLTYLRSVTFPATLEIVEEGAFEDDARLDVLLPEGIVVGKDVLAGTLSAEKEAKIRDIIARISPYIAFATEITEKIQGIKAEIKKLAGDGKFAEELSAVSSAEKTSKELASRLSAFLEKADGCLPSLDADKAEGLCVEASKAKAEAETLLKAALEEKEKVARAIEDERKAQIEKEKQERKALEEKKRTIESFCAKEKDLYVEVRGFLSQAEAIEKELQAIADGVATDELSALQASKQAIAEIESRFSSFLQEIAACLPSLDVDKAKIIFDEVEKARSEAKSLCENIESSKEKTEAAIQEAKKAAAQKRSQIEALRGHLNDVGLCEMSYWFQNVEPLARPMAQLDERFHGDRSFVDIISKGKKEMDALGAKECSIFQEFDKCRISLDVDKARALVKQQEELFAMASQIYESAVAAWQSKRITVECGIWNNKPIVWRLFEVSNNHAFLISEDILGIVPFRKKYKAKNAMDYNESDICHWLYSKFINSAFTEEEKRNACWHLFDFEFGDINSQRCIDYLKLAGMDRDFFTALWEGETRTWWALDSGKNYAPVIAYPEGKYFYASTDSLCWELGVRLEMQISLNS